MSGSQLIPTNTFATQSGNIALSLLDTNFSQVASFLNNPNNYTNYLVDSGGANAYVVTFPTGVIPSSYTAGLTVVMKVANANTGASTLNVNSLGTKNILNPDASSLSSGQLASGSLVMVVYDGTQFILLGGSATTTSTQSYNGFKNRIINGAMVIDQRNAGAAVTAINVYALDRYKLQGTQSSKINVQQNAGSVTPPSGFVNYLGATSQSAFSLGATDYFRIFQPIEGFNTADLAWGTASASSVTLSFWVRSSLTGTHGGSFSNNDNNRYYVYSYTISLANTWEYKTITVAGDTSGTWNTTNSIGIQLGFNYGTGTTYSGTAGSWGGTQLFAPTGAVSVVGTNGATFYITGVQLEKGSTATSFDYRPYGTELALAQRYYYIHASNSPFNIGSGFYYNSTYVTAVVSFPVTMRVSPALVQTTGTNYYGIYVNSTLDTFDSFNVGIGQPSTQSCSIEVSSGVSGTAGNAGRVVTNNASASIAFNSEL
jgi:hypothetical protein